MKRRLGKQLCRSMMKTCHICKTDSELPSITAGIFHQHNTEARIAAKMRRAAAFVVLNRNYAFSEYMSCRHVIEHKDSIRDVVTWIIEDVHTFGTADYSRAIY